MAACLMRPRIVDFAMRWLRRALTMRCFPRSAVRKKLWTVSEEASAAIIDATLIESAVHPHTHVEVPVEDWAEDENPDEPACVVFSSDHDARWIKKGSKSMLDYIERDTSGSPKTTHRWSSPSRRNCSRRQTRSP